MRFVMMSKGCLYVLENDYTIGQKLDNNKEQQHIDKVMSIIYAGFDSEDGRYILNCNFPKLTIEKLKKQTRKESEPVQLKPSIIQIKVD